MNRVALRAALDNLFALGAMQQLRLSAAGVRATVNHTEICYESFGDPRDPAVLLIAGFGEQMIVWRRQFCHQLSVQGYWVIRFDNRDTGQSAPVGFDAPSRLALASAYLLGTGVRTSYSLDDMARDAVALLDYLRIGRAHIVGRCLGGLLAQIIAINCQDRVKTLTSMMSTSGDRTLKAPHFKLLSRLFARAPQESGPFAEHMAAISGLLSGKRYPFEPEAAFQQAKRAFERGQNDDGLARQLAAFLSAPNHVAALRELRTPTLVIHGDDDPFIPVEHAIDAAEAIPTANLRIIPGLGHTLPAAYWPDLIQMLVTHFYSY